MRVVSGKYKGRRLVHEAKKDIRATSDRVKETVFNIILHRFSESLIGKNVIDLFAGTGALGIEALSQGAKYCYFLDSSKISCKNIIKNLTNLGINHSHGEVRLVESEVTNYEFVKHKISLIFCDPPYNSFLIQSSLNNLKKWQIIDENCLIVCESNNIVVIDGFHLLFSKEIGFTKVSWLEMYE